MEEIDESRIQAVMAHCMQDGIVNLDRLQECKDYEAIEYVLKNYPITTAEYLLKEYEKGNLRRIFEYSVDHELDGIVQWVLDPKTSFSDAVKNYFYPKRGFSRKESQEINRKYLRNVRLPDEVNKVRTSLLDQLRKTLSFEPVKEKFTPEYFQAFLDRGQYELLALNLCSRLDLYLGRKKGLEGTCKEKWDKFKRADSYFGSDEEYGDAHLVDKLIIYRNKVAHADTEDWVLVPPTVAEFKRLIQLICRMR